MTDNDMTREIIGAAIEDHQLLSSGLLELAYEECCAHELHHRNLSVDRQIGVPVGYTETKRECGYRTDPLFEGRIVVKLKSAETIAPIHEGVILTYRECLDTRLPFPFTSMWLF